MAKRKGMTRAGQLFHVVDIEKQSQRRDNPAGRQRIIWKTILKDYPANVTTLKGTDKDMGGIDSVLATASHRVYMRLPDPATAELSPDYRLQWGAKELEIVSIVQDDGNRDINLIVMCKEQV